MFGYTYIHTLCMYIYICIYVYVYIHIYIYVCMYVCIHTSYIHIYVICLYVCMYVCIYTYNIHTYTCICICIYVSMYVYIYIHILSWCPKTGTCTCGINFLCPFASRARPQSVGLSIEVRKQTLIKNKSLLCICRRFSQQPL